jgi:hypothetical protein
VIGRRELITLVGGAAAWSVHAQAQMTAATPVIGWLGSAEPNGQASNIAAFIVGLGEMGYVEGHNVTMEYRWAEDQLDRLPSLAGDLVRRRVTMILANAPPAAIAAKAATSTMPIVFVVGLKATISTRRGNIYKEVLLAAALAQVDELGYFAPTGLRRSLAQLLGKADVPVSLFGQHLKNLCEPDRGAILEQAGSERKYRYRFVEPMMQPFVLMQALRDGSITGQQVDDLAATNYAPRFSSDF